MEVAKFFIHIIELVLLNNFLLLYYFFLSVYISFSKQEHKQNL